MSEEKELWTNSRSRCFLACQREHEFRYVRGYSAVSNRLSLAFGTLMHVGLETWWKNRFTSTRLESSIDAYRAALPTDFDPYLAAAGEALLIGYDTRWGDDDDLEAVAVECEFRHPMVDPRDGETSPHFDNGGKIDVVARRRSTGRLVGIEHKTSSDDIEPGSKYWRALRLDGQSSKYFDGAASLGWNLDEMIYDVIGKVALRPYKATPVELRKYTKPTKSDPIPRLYANQREHDETVEEYFERVAEDIAANPESYFVRVPVVRLEAEMNEYRAEQYQLAALAHEAQSIGFAPRNPGACRRYNSLCDFLPVCTGEASLDDTRLYSVSTNKHRELSQEVQQ